MRLGIIGGGLTGATIARELAGSGIDLYWCEKSRGLGGQCSTRRSDEGSFDHGAPYFEATDERFKKQVDHWIDRGAVAPWNALKATFIEGKLIGSVPQRQRYVGIPGMNELCKIQAGTVPCLFGTRVMRAGFEKDRWSLTIQDGSETELVDALVLTVPAAQAAELMADHAEYASELSHVRVRSTWVAVIKLERFLNTDFEEILFEGGPLKKAIRNRTKPMREGADTWILYGDATWSKENLENTPAQASAVLLEQFQRALGSVGPLCGDVVGHRWRYAQALESEHFAPVMSDSRMFLATGSYCFGSSVEGAWMAGQHAAREIKKWYKLRGERA